MKIIILSLLLLFFLEALSQEDPLPIGYQFLSSSPYIKVYREKKNKPDLSHYKTLSHVFWFDLVSNKTVEVDGENYVQFKIPNGDERPSLRLTSWSDSTDGLSITSDEFNIPLWMKESDFKTALLKYPKFSNQFIFGTLTVPFRIRPAVKSQPVSIFNGDFNVGGFGGYRITIGKKYGLNIIGALGLSSLNQTASNNTAIKDTTSLSILALNYGIGFVLDWSKKFQLGLFFGRDLAFDNLSKTYVYQNKTWVALSLSYKFLEYKKETSLEQK